MRYEKRCSSLAVVACLVALLSGCQSKPTTSSQRVATTNAEQARTPVAAQPTAPAANSRRTTSDIPELMGLTVGASLRQTYGALSAKGFPDSHCQEVGGGYNDCVTRKGMPGEAGLEVFSLKYFHGKLYQIGYIFAPERYSGLLRTLTDEYGEPGELKDGAKQWKIRQQYVVVLDPNGDQEQDGEAHGTYPMASVVDIQLLAARTMDDMAAGRGRFRQQ